MLMAIYRNQSIIALAGTWWSWTVPVFQRAAEDRRSEDQRNEPRAGCMKEMLAILTTPCCVHVAYHRYAVSGAEIGRAHV